jgi:hypothetical protein
MKTCRICNEQKPLDDFSVNKAKADGRHYNCKQCDAAKARHWHHENKDRVAARKKRWVAANAGHVQEKNRNRYARCRDKIIADVMAYRRKNIDRVKKKDAAYHEKNKERRNAAAATWRKGNRDRMGAYLAQRRAAKLQATPKWLTREQRKQIRQLYQQSRLLTELSGEAHTVDHIVPLRGETVCGLHVPWNLRIIPRLENCLKKNKLTDEAYRYAEAA